ncbi:Histone-lysine N-methyltransferase- H3 lysine-9 specific SUVH3 [Striga hermonthica]|uniref:Histone-lysine N-methyltransferase- H3 lysine-9 specific SUVH3 n=1 Tax=Striga hermonthica TaxID=68872 RepID=A0A9N7NLD9_STRHE|nr:Histone-lysine N-methyltransferase- H3 lysine-9 specific SUVH3 [Striga hermonthica]
MERGLGSDSNATPGSIDKSVILEVKPLKTLVPIFPNSPGLSPNTAAQLTGPFPAGVQPFYPFLSPNGPQHANSGPQPNLPQPNFVFSPGSIPAPVPLNSFRTPITQANGSGQPKRSSRTRTSGPALSEDDEYNDSQNPSDQYTSSNTGKRRAPGRRKMIRVGNGEEFDIESLVNHFLTLFKLNEFNDFRRSAGDSDTVASILSAYDFIRKKLTQLEESKSRGPGIARRPDLKAANFMMSKGVRTNNTKRIGHLHEFEIGDMFFFRMELCIVGLHAPSMAGIDYMSVRVTADEEPLAVSIVSSGGYDDDMDDCDVLIYSGQGGVQRRDGQMFDQKLERGNLALEKSLHRANDVRVVRGIKDIWTTGKIYVYDGVYRIQESWAEKNKLGCNVFKYKLVRVPGQPEGFSLWKSIQQWKDGIISRPGIILPDLTSGAESIPVALVNDVDSEKGPAHFTYVSSLRYTRPFSVTKPSFGCHCIGGCQPGDSNCPCIQRNDGGLIPYSSIGVLLTIKSPIYECGPTCACPLNCRNRTSQTGVKVRLEVFKTKSRGWGLRSWDPIRAGGFICEYAGDVIEGGDFGNENDDDNSYVFDATREYTPLEPVYDSSKKTSYPLVISAKNNGNVARFMNHSCSPNVFWQPVLREGDSEVCLHVAFFAARHIPPMRELTYDYGKVANGNGEKGKKKCLCGTAKCKGYFY